MSNTLLFVTMSLDLGGAERHLAQVTPRLKALGWEPQIYCLWRRGQQADCIESQGIPVLGPDHEIPRKGSTLGYPIWVARSALTFFRHLRRERPRIVHFFLPGPYLVGAPLAILAGTPIKVMSRRSLNLYQQNHPLARIVEPLLHKRMAAVVGNSRRVVRNLIEDEGCPPDQVGLIHNGVELPEMVNKRKPRNADNASLRLVTVANLIKYKGHTDLVRALASISNELPPEWELICIGRDDGAGAGIAQLAEKLNISNRIRLVGERNDVAKWLQSADIGILASHQEGFSNALLEGMAAGLPMVVSDVGGNPDAIVDGETGLVVPAKAPASLASALRTLALDPKLRTKMGKAARQRAKVEFSMERCVERYDKLYRALLAGRPVSTVQDIAALPSHSDRIASKGLNQRPIRN